MTNIITQYVNTCHSYKRIKTYREEKHDLLKSLSISKKYWQNINVDFITSLFVCVRNEKLFKKRNFIFMNFIKFDAMMQIFVKWIWKKEKYLIIIIFDKIIIMFDKKTQFVNYFWARLCAKINIKSKLFIFFHSKIDDQIENVNETFK